MVKDVKPNLSYFAGFFDGEGTINIGGTGALIVQIGQCNRWILELYKMQFGGAICVAGKKPPASTSYIWSLTARKAMDFLEIISSYLTLKKPEAVLSIAYQKKGQVVGRLVSQAAG